MLAEAFDGDAANRADSARSRDRKERISFWDAIARRSDRWTGWGGGYHRRLQQVYRLLVPSGLRVLEIGCGRGDLLAAVRPQVGIGIDFSPEMIERARRRHPELRFIEADVQDLDLEEVFDVIILSDVVNDLWDVQAVLERLRRNTTPRTRIIINAHSRLWELPLRLAARLGLANPSHRPNWLMWQDIANLLELSEFELIRHWEEVLWPVRTPLIEAVFNRFLARFWPLHWFSLCNFLVARPQPARSTKRPLVSVIVPARNEAGHMAEILARIPEMGRGTEIVFVEGHSRDNTYEAIQTAIAQHPDRRCVALRQTGEGKGDAVRLGFAKSKGDVLMILDADMTVPPEDLPRFYDALLSNRAEFVNGVRLVYPLGDQSMRFANMLGNKFFSLAFTWLLGQPIKDTLCGTKVLWREDYERIVANRSYFGDFDPFGDFDLLFGARFLNLKIVDLPIRYRERVYGTTNIHRWSHGWLLLKMVGFAARRIKFV